MNFSRLIRTYSLADLVDGLRKLTFGENFQSFEVEVTIAAGAEQEIRNLLRDTVPTKRIIVRGNSNEVVYGDTEWTTDFVYLKNIGASDATATVVFLK
jgi:hypothetical protein